VTRLGATEARSREKALKATDFPIELSGVRVAADPLHSTAKGTLVAGLCEA